MAYEPELLFCPACQRDVFTETPPCLDGHDPQSCPDRACVDCGTALLLDAPLYELIASRAEPAADDTSTDTHAA